MKGKLVTNITDAIKALFKGYDLVLVEVDDQYIKGHQVILRNDAIDKVKDLDGYNRTAPPDLSAAFLLSENPPKSYLVENQTPEAILEQLRAVGYEIEFESAEAVSTAS